MNKESLTNFIKDISLSIGFSKVGIAKVEYHKEDKIHLDNWIENNYHATMSWMLNNKDKRTNISNYYNKSKSVISVAINYFNGKCYKLSNPVLGAEGNKQSVVPAIASKLQLSSKYIFLTTGWGGTSITSWGKDNSELSEYTNKNLKELNDLGHQLRAVIWIQGTADIHSGINYIFYFNKMKSQILKGLENKDDVKFIITKDSICDFGRMDNEINKQKKYLAKKEKNIFFTEVVGNLDSNYRYDGCHFNKFGTEEIAKEISSILNNILR